MALVRTLLVGLATAAALRLRPTITLTDERVEVDRSPDEVIRAFRDRMTSGDEVIAAGGDRVVRRFSGEAGRFRYDTVEVVSFEPMSITFEHLRGPFSRCRERFDAAPHGGGTTLTHSGSFALRGGLFTWPLACTAVKRAFERHVREHMQLLVGEAGAHELVVEPVPPPPT
jgi:hypothetical protein